MGVPTAWAACIGKLSSVTASSQFAKQAAEAGLRYAYLQFDGIGNAANSHRLVGNLFDVKIQAIENLHNAGVEIVPVVTIVNDLNNEQVGRIIQFALDNPKRISFLSFQPVSFTGRDEEITDERRAAQRTEGTGSCHGVLPDRTYRPVAGRRSDIDVRGCEKRYHFGQKGVKSPVCCLCSGLFWGEDATPDASGLRTNALSPSQIDNVVRWWPDLPARRDRRCDRWPRWPA